MIKNENGRSMVEMLGVLAIIGVLSVAGIAGYTMAMNKYRSNEILNVASQVAILAKARYENDSSKTTYNGQQAGYTGNVGGIPVANIVADAANETITITGAANEVANNIKAASNCAIGDYSIKAGTACK